MYLTSIIASYIPPKKQVYVPLTNLFHLHLLVHVYGDRAFASAAPILWNKLPDKLRAETDTSSFMKSLKTYIFFTIAVRKFL